MKKNVQQQIVQFNRMFKRYDDIYRRAAKKFDLPELALWIIYVLRENTKCTQKDIVEQLLHSKQSIHSSLKVLEKKGYVKLECLEDDRRSKYVSLTEKGLSLARDTADKIVAAENLAFLRLTDTEREVILNMFERLTSILEEEMEKI
ncbi:MAG: MarR family transcriptional regulator [Roseburia sp.]|nr:MarR family transcriptional regulator [Roseburia sp.]